MDNVKPCPTFFFSFQKQFHSEMLSVGTSVSCQLFVVKSDKSNLSYLIPEFSFGYETRENGCQGAVMVEHF